jgi:hypothetical protein
MGMCHIVPKVYLRSKQQGTFRIDDEEDIFDLERLLVQSRRENREKGEWVHEGHKLARQEGRRAGGALPYVLEKGKEPGSYVLNQHHLETVKEIYRKVLSGWGVRRIIDYLDQYPDRFPKKPRIYNGKPIIGWNENAIRSIVYSDFYFTGVIPSTSGKNIPLDTKIKLFDKKYIMKVRHAMSVRRNRKLRNEEAPADFALLRGYLHCAYCGWKMTTQVAKRASWHHYYLCKGRYNRANKICKAKQISGRILDRMVWNHVISTLQDPEQMQELILRGDFLSDKERKEQEASLIKAEKKLKALKDKEEKLIDIYLNMNQLSRNQYEERMKRVKKEQEQRQEAIAKLQGALQRPQEVEKAVREATQVVAVSVGSRATFRMLLRGRKNGDEKLRKRASELWRKTKRIKLVEADQGLVFEQKRNILQEFIDPEKGIVLDTVSRKFDVHISLDPSNSTRG